jgi:hypothetical protein
MKNLKLDEETWKLLKEYCDKENKKISKEAALIIRKFLKKEKEK